MLGKFFKGVFLVLVGTAIIAGTVFYVLYLGRAGDARSQWPTVQGTVVASDFRCIDWGLLWRVSVHFEFAYEVQGTYYVGKQKWSRGDSECIFHVVSLEAERGKLKYSPGTIVPVYYNPQNHTEAAIEPSGTSPVWFELVFLVGLLGFSLVCFGIGDLTETSAAATRPQQG